MSHIHCMYAGVVLSCCSPVTPPGVALASWHKSLQAGAGCKAAVPMQPLHCCPCYY
jgi:hypothetical protein